MKITEAEMDLREATREVEQLQWAMTSDEHTERSTPLAVEQDALAERTTAVAEEIRQLPNGREFGREITMLETVAELMRETEELLRIPETGPPTIAVETEAIELLLAARRSGGGGGGGGGNNPGGGGGGEATVPALALVGRGAAAAAQVDARTVDQTTGDASVVYPSEYREGLDHYFGELDGGR